MHRTTLTLIGAVAALTAVTGAAAVTAPDGGPQRAVSPAERRPVQRSTLVCPPPPSSEVASTRYTAVTPAGGPDGGSGSAGLLPAPAADPDGGKPENAENTAKAEPALALTEPGAPRTSTSDKDDAPAWYGSAEGRLAPGWTVQQTTTVAAGAGRGLSGTSCAPPGTDFWFPGASTAEARQDYVHLTNPDDTAAVVDLELYGKDGRLPAGTGEGVTVPPHTTVPVLLSTLTSEPATNLSVHVQARSGRIGAQIHAADEELGGDWLPASAPPRPSAVMPGIPGDAKEVRLVVLAPGERDADVALKLSGPSGTFTPAGHETLRVRAGMTTAVDLGELTRGETGTLRLVPAEGADPVPVVAALRITRGEGDERETAFVPATAALTGRGTAADNEVKGSTLALTAPGTAVQVRVTASAGSEEGRARSATHTVKPGTTLSVAPPEPSGGKGTFAVTVERVSGGELYAARVLERESDGVAGFTVQPLPDDGGSVVVPSARQELSVAGD